MWEKYLLLLMEYPFDEFEPPRSLRLFIPILSFLKSLSVYFIFYFLNLNYVLVLVVSIIFWRCRFVSVRCEMSGTLLCKDFRYIQSMLQVSIQSISSIFFFSFFCFGSYFWTYGFVWLWGCEMNGKCCGFFLQELIFSQIVLGVIYQYPKTVKIENFFFVPWTVRT